ncbi:MAG: heterodisulfide reductase-related iron-sulfur binding cluster [Thermoprotei archaeon]
MGFYDLLQELSNDALREKTPMGIPLEQVLSDDPDHEYLLFTGYLYQMTPYMEALRNIFEKYEEESRLMYSAYPLFKGLMWHFARPSKAEKERYYNIIRRAYADLKKKIDIGYDSKIDAYSGIIYHDFALPVFEEYAKRLSERLMGKKLVTLDPHTTYALRVLFKKVNPAFNAEIHHYAEFLSVKNAADFVDHESCYLNRYLKLNYGSDAAKLPSSGKETGCCGGPIEFISPRLATSIANSRVDELMSSGKNKILVWCPVCLSNLSRIRKAEVVDALELEHD